MLAAYGARDVLVLGADGETSAAALRRSRAAALRRASDVRKNNCEVAILHGRSMLALAEKAKFARFSHVLVPTGSGALPAPRRDFFAMAGEADRARGADADRSGQAHAHLSRARA